MVECYVMNKHVDRMNVIKISVLEKTRKDKIRNEGIRDNLQRR